MITKEFILENKDKWEEYKEEINKLDSETLGYIIIEGPDIISIIDLDKLAGYDIYWILKYHPGLIRDLKPYLDKLAGWNIRDVLTEQSELINYFKPHLHKLDGLDISEVLKYQPGLIKDLKPYLDKLNRDNIYWILVDQPKLIKHLKSYLHKLTDWPIFWILKRHPDLIKDLRPYLDKLSGGNISDLLEKRLELSLLFKYLNTEYQDAAYYYTYPSEISKLDEEEKYELSKKMVELIRKEKK